MADSFEGGFNQTFGGTLNALLSAQHSQLQEQANKMQQYSTLGNIIKSYDQDPAIGEATLTDFMKTMKIDPDQQALYLKAAKNMTDTTRSGVVDALSEAGMQPSAQNVQQLMRAGPANLFTMLQQMRTAKGQQATGAALNEQDSGAPAPAATGAAPVPTAGDGGGAAGPTAVAASAMPAPGSSPAPSGAPVPAVAPGATGGAPVPAMPSVVQSALGAPPATAMPGMPDGHAAPDATHPASDTPAYAAAAQYQKMMSAASRLESNRNPDGSVKPSYPEQAQKLRDEAEKVSKAASVTISGNDPRVKGLGLLPNTVVQYNTATRQMSVIQAGNQTWNTLDPKDPKNSDLYAAQTPGTLIARNAQTGEIGIKVAGANIIKPATPGQLQQAGIDPADIPKGTSIQRSATGELSTKQLTPEQEVPVTSARRAELAAQGVNLDPNHAYTENATTKKLTAVQTGQTAESERVALTARSDQKELDEQRANASANASTLAGNQIIRNLVQKYGTGSAGDFKLLVGQLATQFDVKLPKGVDINTPAGEALRSTLGNRVVEQATTVSGPKSFRELNMFKQNAGNLLLTPEGNNLITNIADWKASQGNVVADLANNWDGPLSQKAATGPYAGKNYYQAKADIQGNPSLPPELRDELTKQVGDISAAKKILPKIGQATAEELQTLKKYGGLMTNMEKKRAAARWDELGLQ